MWIISNDHSTLVKLDGTLKVRLAEHIVTIVYEDNTILGLFKEESEAVDIITKIAETLENGARDNYIYEMPPSTYSEAEYLESRIAEQKANLAKLDAFGSLPSNIF